jgi:hypothetical protein
VPQRRGRLTAVRNALDEARFGAERTLNLRATLPTPQDAVARTDHWLRLQQSRKGGEVLIITGRGNQSPGGVSVVRAAITKLLASLKRNGVVASVEQHTPGSFVVTLAPMRALLEAPQRHRGVEDPRPPSVTLSGIDRATHELLERLARCALDRLGVRDREKYLDDEMRRQFSLIIAGLPSGARRDEHLRTAIERALAEFEED